MQLVGILNITPDSFSDGGLYIDPQLALKHAEELFVEGASFIDIGAESTRPNATPLSDDEEWQRLEPVLRILIPKYAGHISLDSYHPKSIERAFVLGPVIVNDVTGMTNPRMVEIVTKLHARCIVSHLPVNDIQESHRQAPIDTIERVRDDLLSRAATLEARGLTKNHIILDPGIGFGKTTELNWKLLAFAGQVPDYKVMIGYSRKRFLGNDRMQLEPNLAAGIISQKSGAAYLRVHDVRGHAALLR